MPAEGVVDALRKVHRTLRPGGALLDIHPRTVPSPIEVRAGGGSTPLGQMEYNASFIATISNAEQALARMDAEGAYGTEQQAEFLLLHHFESAAQWLDYREDQAQYYAAPGEALVEAVRGAMAPPDAVMIVGESVRATRFRRPS